MNRIKRPAVTLGAAALLAVSLTACGGGGASGAPEDASTDDFCSAFEDYGTAFSSVEGEKPTEEEFDEIIDKVDAISEVGTPEDISEGEREGFEIFVDELGDLDYSDVEDAEGSNLVEVSDDDNAKVEEFVTYAGETCSGAGSTEE